MTEPPDLPLFDRLGAAVAAHHRFLAGEEGTADELIRRYPDLRDLLEAMLEGDESDDRPRLGDYVLLRELGRGGMGVVWEAVQESLQRRVALKVLPRHLALEARAVARFQREAVLAASLDHPGITRIYGVEEIDDLYCFAMELVAGAPLDAVVRWLRDRPGFPVHGSVLGDAVRALRPLDDDTTAGAPAGTWRARYVDAAVEIAAQVAEALDHAHRGGIIHRDVKPANILLRADGTALLTDFGLAREEGTPGMTMTGDLAGTVYYMSPEQLELSPTRLDARTDVFSLGATLYELLTLRRAFEADTESEVRARIRLTEPRHPRRANPAVGRELAAVVMKALEKDRGARYPSAAEFAADLRRWLERRPVTARAAGPVLRARRWCRRNPMAATLVTVLLAGSATVVAFERRASAALRNYDRLGVGVRVAEILRDEPVVFPAWPDRARQLADLAGRAEQLVGRDLPSHQALLRELRRTAAPRTSAEVARDRADHPGAARLQRLRQDLAALKLQLRGLEGSERDAATARARPQIDWYEGEIRALDTAIGERRTYHLADEDRQFLHDSLSEQVRQLVQLRDVVLPSLRFRQLWAESIGQRSLVDAAAAWQRATTAIAASDGVTASKLYDHLVVRPQVGLVPIGIDPASKLWEFAHLRSGRPPRRDASTGELRVDDDSGIVFVLLPPARFAMGATREPDSNQDPRAADHEGPVHEVRLDAFFVSKYELGHAQWQRLAEHENLAGLEGATGPPYRRVTPLDPVTMVSWHHCRTLLERHGLELPTEAQWEYACRAGTSTPWWPGEDPGRLAQSINAYDRAAYRAGIVPGQSFGLPGEAPALDDRAVGRLPIATFAANPFGLHHMAGNVLEWCRDGYDPRSYAQPVAAGDGHRQSVPSGVRCLRGGAFNYPLDAARTTARQAAAPTYAGKAVGVRPARRLRP